jgi:N-acyl homoserine lactone hydrolase
MKLGFMIPFHIPVVGYLIQTDDGLNVLVDTGFSHHLIGKYRHEEQPFVRMDEADYVVNQLARLGLAPQDVHSVMSSHFDPDHAGNLTAFPRAQVVVQRQQYVLAKVGLMRSHKERTKPPKQLEDACCCSASEQRWWKIQRDGAN